MWPTAKESSNPRAACSYHMTSSHQGNIFPPYKTHKTSITGCFNQHKQMAAPILTQRWAPRDVLGCQRTPGSIAGGFTVPWQQGQRWVGCCMERWFQAEGIHRDEGAHQTPAWPQQRLGTLGTASPIPAQLAG